jgi:hypothetical protein
MAKKLMVPAEVTAGEIARNAALGTENARGISPRPDIMQSEVVIAEGGDTGAVAVSFEDNAAATLVLRDYEKARGWLDQNSMYMEWEIADILYQSPTLNYEGSDAVPRVSDFTVNNAVTTMGGEVKRQMFAQQIPFLLRPRGATTNLSVKAWTALLEVLLARMDFQYHVKRAIDCMTLQGTCFTKLMWNTRTYTKHRPKRKGEPQQVELPVGGAVTVPTTESETFELIAELVTESWPAIEFRDLGSTLPDPRWSEYNHLDMAGYVVDVDYLTFDDLEGMRQLDCYSIPSTEELVDALFASPYGGASEASEIAQSLSSSGAPALHAESQTVNTSIDPLLRPIKIISRFDKWRTIVVLEGGQFGLVTKNGSSERAWESYGTTYVIQNEPHKDPEKPDVRHCSAVWRWILNSGYGIGLGRLTGCQQRVKQGVINHALRDLAYRFNAPLLTAQGTNAPTSNVLMRKGGYFPVAGPDIRKAIGFLEIPPVAPESWSMLQWGDQSADQNAGNDPAMSEGNISQRGSSAARTATGAARVAQKSDQRAADPIDNVTEGIVVPSIYYLIDMVKMLKMPIAEIKKCLESKLEAQLVKELDMQTFLDAELEVRVMAGQKLAAKASIAQILPLIMQFVQQPDIVRALHDEGKTVDFAVIMDLIIQFSELIGQPDIVRDMTDKEKAMVEQAAQHPVLTKQQTDLQKEQLRGQNKLQEVAAKGDVDLKTKMAEAAIDKLSGGQPLLRAEGFDERRTDQQELQNGVPGL